MEFKRVDPPRELLEATAAIETVEVVFCGKYEICMIAGMEDDSLICYAVFSHIPSDDKDVYLEHLYTIPERREEGISHALLQYSEQYLKKRNVISILSRMFVKPEDALEYNDFLINRGFYALSLTGRMLEYRLRDMLDAGTIQTVLKNRSKLPPVLKRHEVGEQSINALLSMQRETGFFFFKDECDDEYSRFYLEDGKIHGAIIASRPRTDTLYISALYMDRVCEKKNMFLVLFSCCLEQILTEVEERDINVVITLYKETIYNGLLIVFNPPEEELLVLEHMRVLGDWSNSK